MNEEQLNDWITMLNDKIAKMNNEMDDCNNYIGKAYIRKDIVSLEIEKMIVEKILNE